jgi:hypothetical protein
VIVRPQSSSSTMLGLAVPAQQAPPWCSVQLDRAHRPECLDPRRVHLGLSNHLILHTVGLAFLVSANVAPDARILAWRRSRWRPCPLPRGVARLLGDAISALLLAAYPTKATSPIFYVARAHRDWAAARSLIVAILRIRRSGTGLRRPRFGLSGVALVCWLAAVTAGRLHLYAYADGV